MRPDHFVAWCADDAPTDAGAILRKAGIVQTRREAQFIRYSLASKEAEVLLEALCSVFAGYGEEG